LTSAIYTIMAFVIVMAIIIWPFRMDGDEAFGFTCAIIAIAVISDLIRRKIERKDKAGKADSVQMQADLNELKKGMAEIREYVTDLYIQQHDKKLE